jgi:ribosomal protein L40E
MNCKKCGAENDETFKYCNKCGEHVVQELSCAKCGKPLKPDAKFCVDCGTQIGSENTQSAGFSYKPNEAVGQDDNNVRGADFLDEYYKIEFQKIKESKEAYKGKWNWAAFFFGPLWALTKGAWLSAVVCFVICIATFGFVGIIYWFVYGIRGNYIYYCVHEKNSQQVI